MRQALTWLITALYGLYASSDPVSNRSTYAVKDRHVVPPGWTRVADAPADHALTLKIGLRQDRFEELEVHLFEVSDPSHHRYGKHLTKSEVDELVQPANSTIMAVKEWLRGYGVYLDALSFTKPMDWITVRLPIQTIERMLEAKYSIYEHTTTQTRLVRTESWSLPLDLHNHIVTIQPTNSFWRLIPKIDLPDSFAKPQDATDSYDWATESATLARGETVKDVCDVKLVTPLCIRTLYGTIDYRVQSAGKNKMALNNFLGELNLRSDAKIHLERFRPAAVSGADEFEQISVAGGSVQQTPLNSTELNDGIGGEGNLDAQTMLGIGWPTPLVTYSTGGVDLEFIPDAFTEVDEDEPYLVWLQYILAQNDIPQVISNSYADDEQTISKSYAIHVCNLFAQLGARGITVLFASGDYGVGGNGYCFSNDGKNSSKFLPTFPASCPYVTAVGGTYQFEPEVAGVDRRGFHLPFTSGGGFSNYFDRPGYQKYAVEKYLKTTVGDHYEGLYNPAGRAYPDIAAQSVNYSTVWNRTVYPIDGTSAAAPAAAAILALVNDYLIANGRSTLGFINPWLYAGGYKAFNDVLSGSTFGCNVTGFEAAEGWDAVTGWGTPQFPKILEALDQQHFDWGRGVLLKPKHTP